MNANLNQLSEMIRELRAREAAVLQQENEIARYLVKYLGGAKIPDWPRPPAAKPLPVARARSHVRKAPTLAAAA